jgi:xylulokinase
MSEFFLGLDAGTQSTKTVAVEGQAGKVIGSSTTAYELIPGLAPGHKEQDPQVWLDAADETIRAVLAQARAAGYPADALRGLGVSGQQHGFVPLDENDRVIRPAKLWNDTSTAPECEEIMAAVGGRERFIELTGNALPPGFTASKILWLKKHEPHNFARLRTVLLPHDYINFWLTGVKRMEHGDASGTALMDVRRRVWAKPVLKAIDAGLEGMLPPLEHSAKPQGTLREELKARWEITGDVLVSSGGGDNMMGAIGTGNVSPGIVTVSLGTSGTIYACSDMPVIDPLGEVAAFCDSTGHWLPLVCTMNVTVATEMVCAALGLDHAGLARAATQAPAGSDGLLLVPFFEGERTPNCPEGTGVFFGARPATFDAPHLARAAMEGATLGLNYGLSRMRELGIEPREIRATGGGAKNAVWRQILADVFNAPVVCLNQEEGAAYGAAIQAKWSCENRAWAGAAACQSGDRAATPPAHPSALALRDITDCFLRPDESTRALPNPAAVARYRDLQELFNRLVADLRGAFTQHRALL